VGNKKGQQTCSGKIFLQVKPILIGDQIQPDQGGQTSQIYQPGKPKGALKLPEMVATSKMQVIYLVLKYE
jgi:hypothetical protein